MEIRTAYRYAGEIMRVVDGDTVDVRMDLGFDVHVTERVRLLGVDTPERFTDPGREAIAYVYLWLNTESGASHRVVVETRKARDTDKYGRYLGRVFAASGACLNDDLLRFGYAKVYPLT